MRVLIKLRAEGTNLLEYLRSCLNPLFSLSDEDKVKYGCDLLVTLTKNYEKR